MPYPNPPRAEKPGGRVSSPGCVALAQSPTGSAAFSRQMNFFQETWDGASPTTTFMRPSRKGLRRLWAVENHQHTAWNAPQPPRREPL